MAKQPRQKNLWVQVSEYTSLAVMLPAATVIGYGIGYLLDRALGTTLPEDRVPAARNRGGLRATDPAGPEGHTRP